MNNNIPYPDPQHLKQIKRHSQAITEYAPIWFAYINTDYNYEDANQEYCDWVGIPMDELIGLNVDDALAKKTIKKASPHMKKAMAGEKTSFESHAMSQAGNRKWLDVSYVPDKNEAGIVEGVYVFILDADKYKQKEFDHQVLMKAIDQGINGSALHDDQGDFTYVNSAQARMYGYEPDELIGKSWKLLYDDDQIKKNRT